MKRYIFIAALIISGSLVNAQQIPLSGFYYYNPLSYNPALAGTGEKPNLFLSHRNQWKNIPGSPQSTTFTFDGPLRNKKIGLGADIQNRSAGFMSRTGLNTYYSYRVDVSATSNINFGMAIGVVNHRIDFAQAVVKDGDDPFLLDGLQQKTLLDANAGVAYILQGTEIGFAVPQLLENSVKYASNNENAKYQVSRNYLFSVKQKIFIDKANNIAVFPLAVIRFSKNIPLQYDLNAVLNWKEFACLGVFYQSDYAVGVNGRVKIHDALSIGYSYSSLTSSLGTYAGAGHEIMLGYSFNIPNKKESDRIAEKQRQDLEALSTKVLALEEQQKSGKADLQKEISALSQQLEQLKKETADATGALKMQIALLQERVELLVKLVGE